MGVRDAGLWGLEKLGYGGKGCWVTVVGDAGLWGL